jgi:hypothetical protein
MRFLWAFRCNPIAQRQLKNNATELPSAIPWAANCLWQLAARNQAVAILF